MLVLTRQPGESIHIGPDIVVTVIEVWPTGIRISIEAPPSEPVQPILSKLNAPLRRP